MKKQHFKNLKLNKKSISNFHTSSLRGGSGACGIESVRICEAPETDTCSINNVACNSGDGTGGYSSNCDTQVQHGCTVDPGGTSNLASPC